MGSSRQMTTLQTQLAPLAAILNVSPTSTPPKPPC